MNQEKTAEEIINMLKLQEDILEFTHFTNKDAFALGRFMVEEAEKNDLHLAISIRRIDGTIIFQSLMDGTGQENIAWMERKFNTVRYMEMSTLKLFVELGESGETASDKFMDEMTFAISGGGFPIRLEEAGLYGAVIVSGAHHVQDHDFIVRCLSKYLHMDEVPRIRMSDFK
ncbi:MAG: heme-binding protein [Lachnospiraceae bacterium]|nr:heme-binding protein [Lachnospiraceae bacterium]